MIKILFCVLTMMILIFKFGKPQPKMMSIYGEIDFIVKHEDFSAEDTVGYMYDDDNGEFSLNPSYCDESRKGTHCFQAHSDCTVTAYCNGTLEGEAFAGHGVIYEPNFPNEDTGSNILIGVFDDGNKFTKSFSNGGEAFRFADVNYVITPAASTIRCNNKDEAHYQNLFGVAGNEPGQMVFTGSDVSLYDRTLKCIATFDGRGDQMSINKAFVLTITNIDDKPVSFSTVRLSSASPTYHPHGNEANELESINASFRSDFVFRATSVGECRANIGIEKGEKQNGVLSFRSDGKRYSIPAIHADASLTCGIQLTNDGDVLEYWCECSRLT